MLRRNFGSSPLHVSRSTEVPTPSSETCATGATRRAVSPSRSNSEQGTQRVPATQQPWRTYSEPSCHSRPSLGPCSRALRRSLCRPCSASCRPMRSSSTHHCYATSCSYGGQSPPSSTQVRSVVHPRLDLTPLSPLTNAAPLVLVAGSGIAAIFNVFFLFRTSSDLESGEKTREPSAGHTRVHALSLLPASPLIPVRDIRNVQEQVTRLGMGPSPDQQHNHCELRYSTVLLPQSREMRKNSCG